MKMKSKIGHISLTIYRGSSAGAVVWRMGKRSKRYNRISPASFGRIQRIQAALYKDMFGRSKSR